ncbi:unnamed protein product, partial [Wuchereria bancrofti]
MEKCLRQMRSSGSLHRAYMIYYLRIFAAVFILLLIIQFTSSIRSSNMLKASLKVSSASPSLFSQIIVITPTYRRTTRLADMT